MKQITISLSEYERLKDLIAQADTRHGLEMAALERKVSRTDQANAEGPSCGSDEA